MKYLSLATAFIALTWSTHAQITIDSADVIPAIGSTVTYYEANNAGGVSEGASGEDVIWDFSSLTAADSFDMNFEEPATGLIGDPENTTITPAWGARRFPLRSTPQSVYIMGDFRGLTRVAYGSDSLLHMKFPMAYNDLHTTSYDIEYGILDDHRIGTYNVQVDGYGSLHMPYGYLNNVMRLEIEDMYVDTPTFGGPSSVNNVYYEYWQKGADNYIVRIAKIDDDGNKSTEVWYQGKDNAVIGTDPTSAHFANAEKESIRFYPNPFNNQLTVSMDQVNSEWLDLEIHDMSGRVVFRQEQVDGQENVQLDLSSLEAGMYVIQVSGEHTQVQETLIKH